MNGRVSGVDSISTRDSPAIERLPVDDRVTALEVGRVLEESVVLVFDERPRDLLLDDLLAPVVLEPRLGPDLSRSAREQQRVVFACNVEVDLHVTRI